MPTVNKYNLAKLGTYATFSELGARSQIRVPAFLAFQARGPAGMRFFLKHAGTQNAKKQER